MGGEFGGFGGAWGSIWGLVVSILVTVPGLLLMQVGVAALLVSSSSFLLPVGSM